MIAASQINCETRRIRLRPIALPVEHGGWALLFEPIVLGMLVAPSPVGLLLTIAAIGGFLARHPFKLAVFDWRRRVRTARTPRAERFALLYASIAAAGLGLAISSGGTGFLIPLTIAAPFVVVQLAYDSLGRSRAMIAELAGSISVGSVSTAIAIAGGWPRPAAFGLWAIVAARAIPTILYLRARLRLLHRKPASPRGVIVAHVLAVLIVIPLVGAAVVPFLSVCALVFLLIRAVIGFSSFDKGVIAKTLGFREVFFGAVTVLAVVLGNALGW